MKNTYLTSYLPILSILLFSLTFSVYGVGVFETLSKKIGVYAGMSEFLSEMQLKLAILVLLMMVFFMILSALKLIAETINGISMLFFSVDSEGELYNKVRPGSMIYFLGGLVSVLSLQSFKGLIAIFVLTSAVYFFYFVNKISSSLTKAGLLGVVTMQLFSWAALILTIFFVLIKLYNGLMASLPIISEVKL
ncbi:YufK family protein [Rossellomorea marisflavi]|uniref:YufK family protein n=2 Tax=Rossellomorea marisflavi TaxID=189381 RepID=UPI0027A12BEF|nr:YufK family protein [Rossellomorea marisflavi]UTE73939.1 YufK family protein [Rossellomorea marisflavi]